VNGRFTPRQKQVYNAVLRAYHECKAMLKPGLLPFDWRKASEECMERELVNLKLLKPAQVRRQGPEKTALKKYYMHGIGHPIGLDVHDVAKVAQPMQAGWVVTCEPGIYIREEKLGIRLENTILIGENGPIDLMANIPLEVDEIEALMSRGKRRKR
jgi:Xaa-Pro aminopeptidase